MATDASQSHVAHRSEKVVQVDEVHLTLIKTQPPKLEIKAVGLAAIGATHAELSPYVYTHFPLDGIQDFDFTAKAPDSDALEEITAEYIWEHFPQQLKGVRIHAATNKLERML